MDTCFGVRHTSMSFGSIGTPTNYIVPEFVPHVISPFLNKYKYILSYLHKKVNKIRFFIEKKLKK